MNRIKKRLQNYNNYTTIQLQKYNTLNNILINVFNKYLNKCINENTSKIFYEEFIEVYNP